MWQQAWGGAASGFELGRAAVVQEEQTAAAAAATAAASSKLPSVQPASACLVNFGVTVIIYEVITTDFQFKTKMTILLVF